ncbi:hypothetical protein FV768_12980 [Vibrio parahaemolyticus]|nr:hypothetical protein [Vibrio parahaemolyticus]EGR3192832.1 hypothetical protein [Vibrio parahaemolyticus]EGR3205718.1 hypothetical protein [Vibrio parahaemolyticus]EGR3442669.1 hypothetical protein [Vibrio parahaemolyticus]EGR3465921.1 hypothetical protein [Vibrio parahaemolyticus]
MESRLQNLPQIIYESDAETNSDKVNDHKKEQRLLLFTSNQYPALGLRNWRSPLNPAFIGTWVKIERVTTFCCWWNF